MAPSLARRRQQFGSKLRVVDKDIRARGKFQQTFVQLRIARLVVRRVHNGAGGSLKSKAEAPLRMMQPARRYLRARHANLVPAAHFGKFPLRAHRVQVHREIRIRHLRFKHALQAARAQILRPETVKMEAVLFRVQGREKRDALDVIPVIVRHKNVRLVLLSFLRRFQMTAEHAQPGSAIQNDACPRGSGQLDASRVAAVAPRGLVHRGSRSAHTPETQRGDTVLGNLARWLGRWFGCDGLGRWHGGSNR